MPSLYRDYIELTKPRILMMQIVTLGMGVFLAIDGPAPWGMILASMVGTVCVSAGAGALNHVMESDVDGLMERTRNRPIVAGRVSRFSATVFGIFMSIMGLAILFGFVNNLVGILSFLTLFLYLAVYTPLKRMSWLNTLVGAVPGAIPPLGGWAVVTGTLPAQAWSLFLILFIWQLPHFYAIAWIFKDDYEKGGFKMLSVLDPDGLRTARQIIMQTILLIVVSVFPIMIGMVGMIYGVGAMLLGGYFLKSGIRFYKSRSIADARGVLKASVFYLPLLLVLMIVDKLL